MGASKNVTGIDYLKIVLKDWEAFCEGHRPFAKAINEVIAENNQLKAEIKQLKKTSGTICKEDIEILKDLYERLVDDYADNTPFYQLEEDRLVLGKIIENWSDKE